MESRGSSEVILSRDESSSAAQECKHAHGTLERLLGARTPQDGPYSLEVVNPTDGSKGKPKLCRHSTHVFNHSLATAVAPAVLPSVSYTYAV